MRRAEEANHQLLTGANAAIETTVRDDHLRVLTGKEHDPNVRDHRRQDDRDWTSLPMDATSWKSMDACNTSSITMHVAPPLPACNLLMVQAMARHASHILDMARKGAEHRYDELKGEIAALVKNFPHLAAMKSKRVSRTAAAALLRERQVVGAAIAGQPTPPKRQMSANARKAISVAQRKRWAKTKGLAAKHR
jgi:hypothetical protein